ncbi:MAG: hypothetical protein K1X78_16935 [Verrucomicrobiaceae bacterium]|nr:hypothetical protein [Verrucomicrobiaceae bacterium]
MIRILRRLLPLLFLAACAPAHAADDVALRTALEKVYHEWRNAVINRNMDAWKRSTSTYRQVVTRNLIISGGQTYPDSIFEIPIQPPEITRLRLLECEQHGPTAHLVYFGKVDLGLDAEVIPENVIVLKFFNEKGAWKFDSNRLMNLSQSPEVRSALQNGLKPDFLDDPAFTPSGVVPATPPECRKPQYVSALQIQCFGYELRASIGGYDYGPLADTMEQQLIIGGLVLGRNDLTLKIKPLPVPEGAERLLEVNAVLINGTKEKPQVRIFTWDTKSATPPAEITLPVYVSPATMRGV